MFKHTIFPAFLFFVAVTGCNNKHYDPGPAPNTPNNEPAGIYTMASAMLMTAPQPKMVILDAAAGGSFYGNSGTRYVFPGQAEYLGGMKIICCFVV